MSGSTSCSLSRLGTVTTGATGVGVVTTGVSTGSVMVFVPLILSSIVKDVSDAAHFLKIQSMLSFTSSEERFVSIYAVGLISLRHP